MEKPAASVHIEKKERMVGYEKEDENDIGAGCGCPRRFRASFRMLRKYGDDRREHGADGGNAG